MLVVDVYVGVLDEKVGVVVAGCTVVAGCVVVVGCVGVV